MNTRRKGSEWIETATVSLAAVVMYHLGVFLFLFLVPLQILYTRRGQRPYGLASLITLAGIAAWKIVQIAAFAPESMDMVLFMLDMLFPIILVGGLYLINMPGLLLPGKTYRFLTATVFAGAASIPMILYFSGHAEIREALRLQFEEVLKIIRTSAAPEGSTVFNALDVETLMSVSFDILFSTFLFGIFLVFVSNWWIGTTLGGGSSSAGKTGRMLSSFSLPDNFVWPLLISWSGIFASLILDLGVIKYVFWNSGLIFLLLYGLQGIAIIRFFLSRSRISRGTRFMLTVLFIFLIMIPGINLFLLIGVPLLGVSEIWISYRKA